MALCISPLEIWETRSAAPFSFPHTLLSLSLSLSLTFSLSLSLSRPPARNRLLNQEDEEETLTAESQFQ